VPLTIIRDDITKISVDAIVNAANTSLQMGGGVCGAIFRAAGASRLQAACDWLAPIQTGEAVITEGFDLPAKHVIHTAGPVYRDGRQGEDALLRACYNNTLELAMRHGCESIAFPLISSGLFGYPKAEALNIATQTIRAFISENDIDVYLVVFDKKAFEVSEALLGEVRSYIDEHYAEEKGYRRHGLLDAEKQALSDANILRASMPMREKAYLAEDEMQATLPADAIVSQVNEMRYPAAVKPHAVSTVKPHATSTAKPHAVSTVKPHAASTAKPHASHAAHAATDCDSLETANLDDLVGNLDESFSATLLRLIDATGKKDPEVYRRANIDRRLFSKIRSNENYIPTKATALAFAVALELTLDQTVDLLARAGFALSPSRKFDVIVEFFIQSQKYDIFEINNVLFAYDQPLLGG